MIPPGPWASRPLVTQSGVCPLVAAGRASTFHLHPTIIPLPYNTFLPSHPFSVSYPLLPFCPGDQPNGFQNRQPHRTKAQAFTNTRTHTGIWKDRPFCGTSQTGTQRQQARLETSMCHGNASTLPSIGAVIRELVEKNGKKKKTSANSQSSPPTSPHKVSLCWLSLLRFVITISHHKTCQ